jgi:hypothetical protein
MRELDKANSAVICYATPYRLVQVYGRFRGTYCPIFGVEEYVLSRIIVKQIKD